MLFKGDDGITRRLGSGQRSNVYGKDPVRSVLDLTKCSGDRADLEYRVQEKLLEKSWVQSVRRVEGSRAVL